MMRGLPDQGKRMTPLDITLLRILIGSYVRIFLQVSTYCLQFVQIAQEQIQGGALQAKIPENIRAYIAEFDGASDHDEYNNPKYSYRLLFTKKLVNKPGQADSVIEFIKPDSELAKTIDKEYWVKK